jgi:hypothetical protein
MNKKQQRKFAKRARIAARVSVQNQWIADALGIETDSRRFRDHAFSAAVKILGAARQIIPEANRGMA